MLALFTANETMRAATGAYATDLADLYAAGYLRKRVVLDAWGTPFVYRREGEGYVLASYGCDGAPGPPPPADWKKAPCEPDIIIRNSGWVQAPRDP